MNGSSRPHRRRLRFEPLEDRRLLSITVNTLVDEQDDSITDGDISLRDAIIAAPFGGTIDFAPQLTAGGPATLSLIHGELRVAKSLTINGPGAELLTIKGNGTRVLAIDDGSSTVLDVEISGITLTGGNTTVPGGGIFTRENLTVAHSVVTGNFTTSGFTHGGGGIYSYGNSLTVLDSVISNNIAGSSYGEGGGIRKRSGSLVVERTTISGNRAGLVGGGISAADGEVDLQIRDSTISGNTASNTSRSTGGGIFLYKASAAITRSTVSDNMAAQGGGIFQEFSTVQLEHVIVAGNRSYSSARDDVRNAIAARFTLIGDNTGAMITDNGGNIIGTSSAPIDPMLGPLANNGGPTQTHALLPGSPAVDRGDPAAVGGVGGVPAFDQRGDPFSRVRGGRIDIGSYELSVPMFVVDTLADENDGNYAAGHLSLREAIAFANASGNSETITFHPSLTAGGPATITLTGGELQIRKHMTIDGPGAGQLTIDASGNDPTPTVNNGDGSRVFSIVAAVGGSSVSISGLTLTGGDAAGNGGAISNSADLTISGLTISGNSAGTTSTGFHGGGISHSSGNLTINDSTISGNSTTLGRGGGIYGHFGNMTITDSTISGNSAAGTGSGGGIYSGYMTTIINSSTIAGNSAHIGGGLVQNGVGFVMTLNNSTISGNLARLNGGGAVALYSNLTLKHSTITGNRSDSDNNGTGSGGGVFVTSQFSQASAGHTIVSGNFRGSSTPNDVMGALPAQVSLIGHAAPLLGPLANNGGRTQTHALLPGSPAIDAGDPSAVAGMGGVPAFDQRGAPFTRVFGGRIDIGAFELQPSGPALPGDYNQNGSVDAADYVVWRKTLGTTGVPAFSGADGNGDTAIDADDHGVWKAHFGQILPPPGIGSALAAPLSSIPQNPIRETFMQLSAKSTLALGKMDALAHHAAKVAAFENQTFRQPSSPISIRRIHGYKVANAAADDLLLTRAIDRVLGAPSQHWSLSDKGGIDNYDADNSDNPSLIDRSLALAVAAWP